MCIENCKLTFVIPAYNEECNIVSTIHAIQKRVPREFNYEIIVVDHNSTDQTVELSKNAGASVYFKESGVVASLRNYGASKGHGEIFVFIDADVLLTAGWGENIGRVISDMERVLTGSWVCVPDDMSWIERYWFSPLQKIVNTHINSGHLIVSKDAFDELGGFDESLETGEDYNISMRAKALGMDVVDDHKLKVVHKGYPKGLIEFVRREYWHGKGDGGSLLAIFNSKVAIISVWFVIFHLILILSLIGMATNWFVFFSFASIIGICILSSYVKYKNETNVIILINSMIYYFYFIARSASIIHSFLFRKFKKRQR